MAQVIQLTLGPGSEQEDQHRFFANQVPTYEDLKAQAVLFYSHMFPSEHWNVHFHLGWEDANDHECSAPLQIVLWNAGMYLRDKSPQDGVLRITAHFLRKEWDRSMNYQMGLGSVDQQQTDRASREGAETTAATQKEVVGGPATPIPTHGNPVVLKAPSAPTVYPSLPSEATPENFKSTLIAGMVNDVPAGHPFHVANRDWAKYSRKGIISHALLIEGAYGVDAQKPCSSCVKHNRPCRIFHPMLGQDSRWVAANRQMVTRTCSWCLAKPTWKMEQCDAE